MLVTTSTRMRFALGLGLALSPMLLQQKHDLHELCSAHLPCSSLPFTALSFRPHRGPVETRLEVNRAQAPHTYT
jgi:hypothetical protein